MIACRFLAFVVVSTTPATRGPFGVDPIIVATWFTLNHRSKGRFRKRGGRCRYLGDGIFQSRFVAFGEILGRGEGNAKNGLRLEKHLLETNPPPLFILPCFPSPPSPSVATRRSPSLIPLSRRSLRPMSNPSPFSFPTQTLCCCWAVGDTASPLPSHLEVDS